MLGVWLSGKMKGEGRSQQEGRYLLLPWGGHDQSRHLHPIHYQLRPVCKTICRLSSMTTIFECIESARFVNFACIHRALQLWLLRVRNCEGYFFDDATVQLLPVVHD